MWRLFASIPAFSGCVQESQQWLGRLIPDKQNLNDQLKQVQQSSQHREYSIHDTLTTEGQTHCAARPFDSAFGISCICYLFFYASYEHLPVSGNLLRVTFLNLYETFCHGLLFSLNSFERVLLIGSNV